MKRLDWALTNPAASREGMLEHVPGQLDYVAEEGRVFPSGAPMQGGVPASEGSLA